MSETPQERLDELVISLKNTHGQEIPGVIEDFEEAISLAMYTGRSDIAGYLIQSYSQYFSKPVPFEVKFFCEYSTGTRLWRSGCLDEAEQKYQACRDIAHGAGDILSASRCCMALGVINWTRGNNTEALALLEKAKEGLSSRRDIVLSNCLNWLGVVCVNLELMQRAWTCYTEALELNEEEGFKSSQGFVLCNLGLLCQKMDLLDQAEDCYRRSMDIQREVGNRYGYADSLANLGMLYVKRGEYEKAIPMLDEVTELQKQNSEPLKTGLVTLRHASALFRTGDKVRSEELFRKAGELLLSSPDHWKLQLEYYGSRIEILMENDRLEEAEDLMNRALLIQAENMPGEDDIDLTSLHARLLAERNRHKEAYEALMGSMRSREKIVSVNAAALHNVIDVLSRSVRRDKELRRLLDDSRILEERNRLLASSQERFMGLVNRMTNIGVLAVNSAGVVTFWNDTCFTFYGYRSDEACGRKISELIVPGYLKKWFATFLEGGLHTGEFEVNLKAIDGKLRSVLVSLVPLTAEETFIIQVDLTSQRRAENQRSLIEAQMRRTQKLEALGTLTGGIAHDFNNLLQGILGNSALLCDSLADGTRERRSAERIRSAAESSAELCRQMLDYAGVKPAGFELLKINEVIRDIFILIETSLPKDVELVMDLASDTPYVEGDRSQLRQVVMNLVLNGAEAIEKGGRVVISTEYVHRNSNDFKDNLLEESPGEGDYLLLQVRDNGVGINPETLRRIFDPFFSTKKTGRGLGLAAVLGIVRGHRGAIIVDSKAGRGTKFSVYFRAAQKDKLEGVEPDVTEFKAVHSGKRILVVDDEEIVRETVSEILSTAGYIPFCVRGGVEALEYMEKTGDPADLIILDHTMPIMTGTEVFKTLREKGSKIPILMVSGYTRDKLSLETDELQGFLQKPFSPIELKNKLNVIFNS